MRTMTASEALDLAIQSERAAGRYFQVAAERADEPSTRALLSGLAVVEESRSIDLEALRELVVGSKPAQAARQVRVEDVPPQLVARRDLHD